MVAFYTDDLFFCHVPKNGGTSVHAAFHEKGEVSTYHYENAYERASFYPEREGRYSFALVRNPWDRIASTYRFIVQKHPYKMFRTQPAIDNWEEKRAELRRCREDFDYWLMEFCEKWAYWPKGLARTGQPFTRTPQTYWLFDGGVQQVDMVWRFEGMSGMWRYLADRFGVRELRKNTTMSPEQMKALPGAPHRPAPLNYRPYYSKRSLDYVAEHFKPDIDRWGYQF